MDEKSSNNIAAIDVEEVHTRLPLPPAARSNQIRIFEDDEPTPLPSSRLKVHAVLVAAQAGFAGYEVLVRRSIGEGSSIVVFSIYKNCLGFLLLRLFSSFIEKKQKPVLNFPALLAAFFLGAFGVCISDLCYLEGLKYTEPAFASAVRNLIPVFTFILAMLFRMEKIDTRKSHGIVKVAGTILLICGWMVLLIYSGDKILTSNFSYLPHGRPPAALKPVSHPLRLGSINLKLTNQQYGIVFVVISCLSFSIFLNLQGFLMEKYAAPVSFASYACFFGVIQVGVVAAIHVHQKSAWLKFTVADAISLASGGIVGSAVLGIQCWAVKQGGPTFVAAYQPLETIITIILSFFMLRESLHVGSLIGAGILFVALYLFLWGKEREHRFDALCVVQDFHGMSGYNCRPSNFSIGMTTEITVESSATRSVFGGPPSVDHHHVDEYSEESNAASPWFAKNNNQPLSMERSAAWVFTQPLFASDEEAGSVNSKEQNRSTVPLTTTHSGSWRADSKSRFSISRSHVPDDASDSSGEMASTRSSFSSKWNYFPRANSVRSIPSRFSISNISPSRANSCRSIASRMASAKVSDSSSDSAGTSDQHLQRLSSLHSN